MKELFLMTPLNRLGTNEKRRDGQKYLEHLDKSIESVLELGQFRPFDWSRHFQYKQRMKAYEEFRLVFPESKQTYQFMDFIETEKGTVRQIVSNLNIALMNPKYCQKKGIYEGQIFFDEFTKEIKFQGRIVGEKGVNPNHIKLWDDALTNRLGLEIEKQFGINYNANKMWEAVRFVAGQYSISPPKQFLEILEWKDQL